MKRHGDMAISAIFACIGVLMFVFTRQFKYGGLTDFGTGFWPRIIAAVMIFCAVILFFSSMLGKNPALDEIVIDWKSKGMKRVCKVAAVLIAFCFVLYLVGLCYAILFMVFCIMYFMEERRVWMLIATPVGLSLFVYVVFQLLLKVKLPMGILLS